MAPPGAATIALVQPREGDPAEIVVGFAIQDAEADHAHLLARGEVLATAPRESNAAIGEELLLSECALEEHITSIFSSWAPQKSSQFTSR